MLLLGFTFFIVFIFVKPVSMQDTYWMMSRSAILARHTQQHVQKWHAVFLHEKVGNSPPAVHI